MYLMPSPKSRIFYCRQKIRVKNQIMSTNFWSNKNMDCLLVISNKPLLKDKYPNFEVGLKCILMVFPYLFLCSYINGTTVFAIVNDQLSTLELAITI